MKNKIYIRADASAKIGLGHLVRCIALAQMLKSHFDIHFVCKEIPDNIESEIYKHGFLLTKIDEENTFLNLLSGQEFVVLDHYELDTKYQKKIKEIGSKLICIDDLHDKEFFADLIINHAPGVNPEDYRAQPYTRFALGTQFALLRPAFLAQAQKARKIEKIETVLICFGGSDDRNLTMRVLSIALKVSDFKKIVVVTGAAYSALGELNKIMDANTKVSHFHAVDENEMVILLSSADLAIVPASGILFEALAAKAIVLTSYYVENQKGIFEGFKELNSILFVDDFMKLNETILLKFLNIDGISPCNPIEGFSKTRILNLFQHLSIA